MYKEYHFSESWEAYQAMYKLFLDPDFTTDRCRGAQVGIDDPVIIIENANTTNLNLGIVDFTPTRWKHFIQHYVDLDLFSRFARTLPTLKPFEELGYTCRIHPKHRLGNCLIGFTARRPKKNQAMLTMLSRTCIWVPTGILDLYLGSLICEEWSKQIGIPVTLRWTLSQLQVINWKSLPFLANMGYLENPEDYTQSSWLQPILPGSPDSLTNRYIRLMQKTWERSLDVPRLMQNTYRSPMRQLGRMNKALERAKMGQPRIVKPDFTTILNPLLLEAIPDNDDDDEELD